MLCSHEVAEKCLFWLVNHELVHKNDMKNTSIIYLAYDMPFCQIIQKRYPTQLLCKSSIQLLHDFAKDYQTAIFSSSFANALFSIESI